MPIFRYLVAFLLLAVFMVQTFSRTAVVVDYYSNTGSFARNCVNKARPQMHCNGQCQLMKKLKAIESKESSAPEYKAPVASDIIYSRNFLELPDNAGITLDCVHHQRRLDASTVDMSYDLFHPPTQA